MPILNASYTKKLPKAKPNIDFRLIPITGEVVSTLPKYKKIHRKIRKSRTAGIGGYTYIVGSQDILRIIVWEHPELTIPGGEFKSAADEGYKVENDGRFYFPYAGWTMAAGRTTSQIRHELEQKLAKWFNNPKVGVAVAAYRSKRAYISGEVSKPSVIAIDDIPLTVRDIIAKSGGVTDKASDYALLTRHNNHKIEIDLDALYRKGDNSQNYILRGGDSLYIGEKNAADKVFVMGEVNRARTLLLTRFGLTLAEALSESGSIRETTANPRGIFVVRLANPKDQYASVYQLSLTSVHSMLLAEQFSLRPRDIVYVTATPLTKWNRVISQLLPTLSVISSTEGVLRARKIR